MQEGSRFKPTKATLLTIMLSHCAGDVFDVTKKAEMYGPSGSYHIFAGKDGSRGLGKSSLKEEDAVSDYSGLPESDMKVLNDWHGFFT